MTIDDVISTIEEKIKLLSKKDLVKYWNWVFPEEERITESSVSSSAPSKEAELMEEISSMLIDEISYYDTKYLIKSYNKLTNEKITMGDLDKDDEEPEDELEDE
jgi:hypothetical protein